MDLNGGHLVARTLKEAGVRHVFTLCGGHILPIYDGCVTEGFERALDADLVTCIDVELDPAAYRRTGQVSMAI